MRNRFILVCDIIDTNLTNFQDRPRPWTFFESGIKTCALDFGGGLLTIYIFFKDHVFPFSHLFEPPQGLRDINNCAPLPHIYALETKKHQIYITAPMRCNGRLVSKVMPHETANIQPTVWRDESIMVQDPKISEDLQPAQTECRISLDSIVNIINQY